MGMTHHGRQGHQRDERGAALLLALMIMFFVAMATLALLTFSQNGLLNTTNLQNEHTIEYAADGAVDSAVQYVRYSPNTYTTTASCLPGGGPVTIMGVAVVVDCSGTYNAQSNVTRVVTFTACDGACNGSNTLLSAQVTFDDYSLAGYHTCTGTHLGTCGVGMTVNSWVVTGAND
jgi:hypothetical protein